MSTLVYSESADFDHFGSSKLVDLAENGPFSGQKVLVFGRKCAILAENVPFWLENAPFWPKMRHFGRKEATRPV